MAEFNFPPNPTDKMIIEVDVGVYFEYDKKTNTWGRLQGFDQYIDLATTTQDGLMSKEDYKKLSGLIVPPPYTTLSNGTCEYKSGMIALTSNDEDLTIDYQVDLYGKDAETGQNQLIKKTVFKIHENTYGIDFRVNMDRLVQNMTNSGKLTYQQQVGPPGAPGQRGPNGRDRLDTGPVGAIGPAGKSIPWPGTLSEDTSATLASPGRGIVNITTSEISPTENYLVVTRANVGSVQNCPTQILPANVNSPWVLVVDDRPVNITKSIKCSPNCGTITQQFCSSNLYYVDVTAIQEAVVAQFNTLLAELIAAKEALVNSWLATLMQVYATSKNACCCAIGNITSKQANRAFRLEIEKLRVKAAAHQMSLQLGNAPDASLVYNLNTGTIKSPPDPHLTQSDRPLPVIITDIDDVGSGSGDTRSFAKEMISPQEFSCEISAQLVQWYENSWHTGSCCGLWVTAGGSDWIVIHSGGASLNEPCVLAGIQAGVQPAYAFPTLNGKDFMGTPTSTQTMARNIDLESKIFKLLNGNSNQVHKIVGDPKLNLQAIVFPLST